MALNLRLAGTVITGWMTSAGPWRAVIWLVTVPIAIGLLLLLIWVTFEPLPQRAAANGRAVPP